MKLTLLLAAVLAAAARAAVVDPAVGPLSPENDPRTSLEESIRTMRLSIDRELVYLARMKELKGTVDTAGMVARQVYPADDEDDSTFGGFTDKVNDGSAVFRPIRPGVDVPAADRAADVEPSDAPVSETPQVSVDPGMGRPGLGGPGVTEPPVETVLPTADPPIAIPAVSAAPSARPRPGRPAPGGRPRPGRPAPGAVVTPEESVDPIDVVPIPIPGTDFTTSPPPMVTDDPVDVVSSPAPGTDIDDRGPPTTLLPGGPIESIEPSPIASPDSTAAASPSPSPNEDPLRPGIIGDDSGIATDASPESSADLFDVLPSTEAPQVEEDDDVCFPAHATVQLDDGHVKTMAEIQLGDKLLVADGQYSEVFMFTHKMASVRHSFVQLLTASGNNLALTKSHYLYVNGNLAAAATVRKGDVLALSDGKLTTVETVKTIMSHGLYNPQTIHGDIVVNGVRASTYTRSVEPNMAHALLAPLRAVYDRVGFSLTAFDMGANYLASLVPSGSLVN